MGARLALHAAAARADDFVVTAGIHPGALVTDQPDSPHLEVADVRGELYFAFAENDRSATEENDREASERHFERTLALWRRNAVDRAARRL
jgi:hypothetical protein